MATSGVWHTEQSTELFGHFPNLFSGPVARATAEGLFGGILKEGSGTFQYHSLYFVYCVKRYFFF